MKFLKYLPVLVLSIFFISSSFAQQDNMMKKDNMKNMKTETKEMKTDSMMMKKSEMNKSMHNDMNMKKDKMKSDNMMKKKEMMAKVDKNKNGVAINGYDPVAYFTDSKSVMGSKMYSYKWNGAEWYFASKNHEDMFKNNPGKYAPQFGGFCAYGVTKNKLVSSDPNAWQIVDGKLYLCSTKKVHKLWDKDSKDNIKKGDKTWMKLNSKM